LEPIAGDLNEDVSGTRVKSAPPGLLQKVNKLLFIIKNCASDDSV